METTTVSGRMRTRTTVLPAIALLALCGVAGAQVAPARAEASAERPRVANPREVAEQLMGGALAARLTADGTVYASVEIRPDGSVVPREFYGLLANDPRFGPVVRAATSGLRFDVPPSWRTAHPDGLWTTFWMFQTNGCEPDVYVAPRDATTIRACVRLEDGKVVLAASDVRFDAPAAHAPRPPHPTLVESQVLPYPVSARRAGIEGVAVARVRLDERGRVSSVEHLAEPADPAFRDAVAGWLRTARFAVPRGWGARPADVRIAFGIARGDECVWTLDRFDGEDVRICAGR